MLPLYGVTPIPDSHPRHHTENPFQNVDAAMVQEWETKTKNNTAETVDAAMYSGMGVNLFIKELLKRKNSFDILQRISFTISERGQKFFFFRNFSG